MTLSLRPATDDDLVLLREVYASTRAAELSVVEWTDAERNAFLDQQFTAQDRYYREHYVNATFDVVEVDGVPVGRLYAARWPEEIRIIDIALLPAWCGRGLGTQLLHALMEDAAASHRALTIHVEHQNPARSLYQRLGFEPVEDRGVHLFMAWRPPAASGSGDDRLVSHAVLAGPEGHEEQLDRVASRVPEGADLLGDERPVRGVEEQRERDAVARLGPVVHCGVPADLARGEHQAELDGVAAHRGERVADHRGERLEREVLEHVAHGTPSAAITNRRSR